MLFRSLMTGQLPVGSQEGLQLLPLIVIGEFTEDDQPDHVLVAAGDQVLDEVAPVGQASAVSFDVGDGGLIHHDPFQAPGDLNIHRNSSVRIGKKHSVPFKNRIRFCISKINDNNISIRWSNSGEGSGLNIETQEIRVFKAIIDSGGFSKAARQLHVTQSAVSQSLAQLEKRLGTRLIRRGSPLGLTDSGQRFLRFAQTVMEEEEGFLDELEQIRSGSGSSLSLLMNGTIERRLGGELTSAWCRRHPLAHLKVDILPSRDIIYAIMENKADLGFGPFQTNMSMFDTTGLFTENRVLVVSRQAPWYEDIVRNPFKTLRSIPLIVAALDDAASRPGARRIRDHFNVIREVGSVSLRLHMVRAGLGVAYLSEEVIRGEPDADDLEVVQNLPFSSIKRTVGLYSRRDRQLSDGALSFITLCREWFASPPTATSDGADTDRESDGRSSGAAGGAAGRK